MNYRRYIGMGLLLNAVLLTGCTIEYDQKDVYRYLKKTYALKGVEVSKERAEFTGEDSYVDYIWKVTANNITFHVKDDYHWGLETLTNNLTDDYRYALLKAYFDPDMLPHFTLDEKEEEGLYSNELIGKFDSKEELQQLYAELESLQAYAAEKGFDIPDSFPYDLLPQPPIHSDSVPGFFIYDSDIMGCVTNITGDTAKEAMIDYIQAYTEYHFSDLYEKFTEDEVKEAVSKSDYRLAIVKENGTFFYDDLCSSGWDEVSFGTLYEIAYPSDELTYADGAADESSRSYFLKNGMSVEREYSYGFGTNEIEGLFGLKLYIEYHKQSDTDSVTQEAGFR